MRKSKSLIAIFMAALMLCTAFPAFGSSIGSVANDPSVGEDAAQGAQTEYAEVGVGSTNTDVYLTVDNSDVLVGVPTVIILDGTPSKNGKYIGQYAVRAQGNIAGNDYLQVYPSSNSVQLMQTGKAQMDATIEQEQINFSSEELRGGATSNGSVTATALSAGSWSGSSSFIISISTLNEYDSVIESRGTNNYVFYDSGNIYSGSRNAIYCIDEVSGKVTHEYIIEQNTDESTYIFTGIEAVGDYIYACTRQEVSGTSYDEDNPTIGDFFIFDKELNLISKTDLGWKASRIIIRDNVMIINLQMKGYNIYDISDPANPTLLCTYENARGFGAEEYQGGEIVEHDGMLYYVAAGFGFGLYVDDITETVSSGGTVAPTRVGYFPLSYQGASGLKGNVHFYDVIVDYPYIYTTVASGASYLGTANDIRGILKCDITDIIDCTATGKYGQIWWEITEITDFLKPPSTNISADIKPTRMVRYGDYLITNTGTDGLAVFDISGEHAEFVRMIKTNDEEVLPLYLTDAGLLVAGVGIRTIYTNNIYLFDLNEVLA